MHTVRYFNNLTYGCVEIELLDDRLTKRLNMRMDGTYNLGEMV